MAPGPFAVLNSWPSGKTAREKTITGAPAFDLNPETVTSAPTLNNFNIPDLVYPARSRLPGAFISAGLCDELLLYVAPRLLGHQARGLVNLPAPAELADAGNWRWHDVRQVGGDLRLLLRPPV